MYEATIPVKVLIQGGKAFTDGQLEQVARRMGNLLLLTLAEVEVAQGLFDLPEGSSASIVNLGVGVLCCPDNTCRRGVHVAERRFVATGTNTDEKMVMTLEGVEVSDSKAADVRDELIRYTLRPLGG